MKRSTHCSGSRPRKSGPSSIKRKKPTQRNVVVATYNQDDSGINLNPYDSTRWGWPSKDEMVRGGQITAAVLSEMGAVYMMYQRWKAIYEYINSTSGATSQPKAGRYNRNRKKEETFQWDSTISTGAVSVAVAYQMWLLYRKYQALFEYYQKFSDQTTVIDTRTMNKSGTSDVDPYSKKPTKWKPWLIGGASAATAAWYAWYVYKQLQEDVSLSIPRELYEYLDYSMENPDRTHMMMEAHDHLGDGTADLSRGGYWEKAIAEAPEWATRPRVDSLLSPGAGQYTPDFNGQSLPDSNGPVYTGFGSLLSPGAGHY